MKTTQVSNEVGDDDARAGSMGDTGLTLLARRHRVNGLCGTGPATTARAVGGVVIGAGSLMDWTLVPVPCVDTDRQDLR